MQKKISILGCGWLGLPLAEALVKDNYLVAGSTTTPEKLKVLAEKNIRPFLIDLNKLDQNLKDSVFFQAEVLVINIPPSRKTGNSYALQIKNLQELLLNTTIRKVIFISSTSVYAPSFDPITEESALENPETSELIQAENMISSPENPWQNTIIRFAGLFGPNRNPGRFLAGKTNLPDPDAPVNLIHLEDCTGIIKAVIAQEKWQKIYNVCADEHPSRREFYVPAAQKLGLTEPTFNNEPETNKPGKLISNQKLKAELKYTFKFPDPLKAL